MGGRDIGREAYHRVRNRAIAERHRIPRPVRRALRQTERGLDPIAVALYKQRTGDKRPIPPRGLRERNAVHRVEWWWLAVEQAERPLHDMLARQGRSVDDFDRALDFGCGAGKVICALRGRGIELHGCDVHEPSIRWLERTFPDLNVIRNEFDPPLPHDDDYFDLLWAWSVLTHFDAERQRAWVTEWARVVRPGGLVLATFNSSELARRLVGEEEFAGEPVLTQRLMGEAMAGDDVATRAESEGVAFLPAVLDGAYSADFAGDIRGGDTFNTPETIRQIAEDAGLTVVEIVPYAVWGQQHCAIMQVSA